MKVTIQWDKAKLAALAGAVAPAMEKTIDALKTEVINSTRMPFDIGDMQNNQTFSETKVNGDIVEAQLITASPQARRLYYHPEYNFQKKNPKAGAYWLEPWIAGQHKDFAKETFKKQYREEADLK